MASTGTVAQPDDNPNDHRGGDSTEAEVRFAPQVIRPAAMDWVKFDSDLARDGSVDPVDKALYAALASFADRDDRDTAPAGNDVPTRHVLAECIGRSVDTVDRSTKRLEAIGLIRVERRRNPKNPKSHLPSVYVLRDHEWWDERAARRAEARRAATPGRTGAATPGRTGAATPGRTGAATPGRTGAAVLLPPKKISLSEGEAPPQERVDERERSAPPEEPHSSSTDEVVSKQAQDVAAAWTAGTGLPRVPGNEREICKRAIELLQEGHDPAHLAAVARWMSAKGWRDLGYALTAKGAPRAASAAPRSGQTDAAPPHCPVHPGAARRAGGECAGCWADRHLDAQQVPLQADAPAQESAADVAAEIAAAKAALKSLQMTGRR